MYLGVTALTFANPAALVTTGGSGRNTLAAHFAHSLPLNFSLSTSLVTLAVLLLDLILVMYSNTTLFRSTPQTTTPLANPRLDSSPSFILSLFPFLFPFLFYFTFSFPFSLFLSLIHLLFSLSPLSLFPLSLSPLSLSPFSCLLFPFLVFFFPSLFPPSS